MPRRSKAGRGEVTSILTAEQREAKTFALEKVRAPWMGILETANATFLLLIAERWFAAGPAAKSLLQTNSSVGLLLSPLIVVWVASRGWHAGLAAAWLFRVAAAAVIVGALAQSLWLFVAACVAAFICVAGAAPLFAALYDAHYIAIHRGELFSRNVVRRIIGGVIFALVAGKLLEIWPGAWRALLGVYALALLIAAACLSACPPAAVNTGAGTHPLRAFRHVRTDRVFRWTLVSWMLMGFANLTMFPLRVEYLANPDYGMHLTAGMIALLTSVIPNAARLLFTRLWGRLFDRMDFFLLRILLNTGFMLGILSFFTGGSLVGLVAGAVLFGISNAGADIAWSLWVTKLAPPGHATEYMAVHTFLTGFRGVIAPFVAFYLPAAYGIGPTAMLMAGLIAFASLLLLNERRSGTRLDISR